MPQLDKATFYLQSTTVLFAFFFLYYLTSTFLIPQIAVSLCVREYLQLEIDEFLEYDSFRYSRYFSAGVGIISVFFNTNLIVLNKFFNNIFDELFLSEFDGYLAINSSFSEKILPYLTEKGQTLYKISKIIKI